MKPISQNCNRRTVDRKTRLLRELGSGKVGYNKYELVNVMMVRKMDGAYFARQISKAKNIRIW